MDVSIAIVNWNTRDLLAQCLQSIYDTVQGLDFEVFVVDNASTDGSVEMVRERFPQVRLIENEENVGFAKANNQAIRETSGRYILLLNSDTVVLPGAIENMVGFMDKHAQVGAVGPMLLNPDGSFQASYADFPTLFSEFLVLTRLSSLVRSRYHPSYPPWRSEKVRQVDWVGGGCLMARKQAIDDVGLLDEGYFMYVEETDWCYRMKKAGWEVHYLPDPQIIHWGGQSAIQQPEEVRPRMRKSELLFFKKHHGTFSAVCLRIMICLTSLSKMALWSMVYLLGGNARTRASEALRSNCRTIWVNP